MTEDQPIPEPFRAGYVTIIGEPNVGKSTLMNSLLQQKISIVTKKPQTTRHKILGILSGAEYQVVFLDTPGIIKPRYLLQEVMMQFASSAIEDADVLLFMIDAMNPKTGTDLTHEEAFARLHDFRKPVYLAINKVDAVAKGSLLPIIDFYARQFSFKEIFPISALRSNGTSELLSAIVQELPRHPPYYPLDIVSEQNERFFVAEIIREKIFQALREEVPYASTVEIVEFKDREAGKTFISANVIVERDSQKGIVIGKKGAALKEIGQLARQEIERFLERPVFLDLHVKVEKQWREKEQWLKRFGYTE